MRRIGSLVEAILLGGAALGLVLLAIYGVVGAFWAMGTGHCGAWIGVSTLIYLGLFPGVAAYLAGRRLVRGRVSWRRWRRRSSSSAPDPVP